MTRTTAERLDDGWVVFTVHHQTPKGVTYEASLHIHGDDVAPLVDALKAFRTTGEQGTIAVHSGTLTLFTLYRSLDLRMELRRLDRKRYGGYRTLHMAPDAVEGLENTLMDAALG